MSCFYHSYGIKVTFIEENLEFYSCRLWTTRKDDAWTQVQSQGQKLVFTEKEKCGTKKHSLLLLLTCCSYWCTIWPRWQVVSAKRMKIAALISGLPSVLHGVAAAFNHRTAHGHLEVWIPLLLHRWKATNRRIHCSDFIWMLSLLPMENFQGCAARRTVYHSSDWRKRALQLQGRACRWGNLQNQAAVPASACPISLPHCLRLLCGLGCFAAASWAREAKKISVFGTQAPSNLLSGLSQQRTDPPESDWPEGSSTTGTTFFPTLIVVMVQT